MGSRAERGLMVPYLRCGYALLVAACGISAELDQPAVGSEPRTHQLSNTGGSDAILSAFSIPRRPLSGGDD